MEKIIYLDNSSTTKPCRTAVDNINFALNNCWGNPSSLHSLGIEAENILYNSRNNIAGILHCDDSEIIFTGSGTEANNLAVFGAAEAKKRAGKTIVTTTIEHPSVMNTINHLETCGYKIIRLKPDKDGFIQPEQLYNSINSDTILVSIMLVNNETGCIMPVHSAKDAIIKNNSPAILHCDCVQAFGKIDIDPKKLGADLISISGHKIHGPKGIGALYKSKKTNIKPIIFGGNQEKGLRSGTESVPLIAGFSGAVDELEIKDSYIKICNINKYARSLFAENSKIVVNSPAENTLPYIINISVKNIRSETLLHFLESKNIYVSSGSACSKGKGSYVLSEMGLDKNIVDSSIRISMSKYTETSDIDALYQAILESEKTLIHRKH